MRHFVRVGFVALVLGFVGACSQGGGTPAATASPAPPPAPPPASPPPTGSNVTISGAVTFDLVPNSVATNGLNYNAIRQEPARGIVVQALNASGTEVDSTITDGSGQYSLSVPDNTDIRIRARARLQESTIANWDVSVLDNTNSNATYVLDGALQSSGTTNSTRNLNAPSGWGGASYTGTRAAAPFALLDVIYEALMTINDVAPGTNFPLFQLFWSPDNRPVSGDVTIGEIGTSSFTTIGGVPTILILGAEDTDTDEYDRHVVAHEFFHYLENELARSDSVGGPHSLSNRLDPRVAFSEGFGNAFSAIVEDDPIYRDSGGAVQAAGFSINVESNSHSPEGWFNEGSVQSILWDIVDTPADGVDALDASMSELYTALTDADYTGADAPTTIFSFINSLRNNTSLSDASITALLTAQSISGTDEFGTGEVNDGSIPVSLPVMKTVTVGGGAVTVCSVDDAGTFNKLANRQFIRLTIPATGSYTLTMTTASGGTNRDPDFFLRQQGSILALAQSTAVDSETLTRTLQAGEYWIEAFDFVNTDDSMGTTGDFCFDFSVT